MRESVWVVETWDADDKCWWPLYNAGFNVPANAAERKRKNEKEWPMFRYRVTRYEAVRARA